MYLACHLDKYQKRQKPNHNQCKGKWQRHPKKGVGYDLQAIFCQQATGQGTGLGLSLSYDIVNAYGADLKVETRGSGSNKFYD